MAWHRHSGLQKTLSAQAAIVCAIAFVWASNYCNVEAFSSHHSDDHSAHQTADPAHHDDGSSTPGQHHEEDADFCCTTIQAVVASRLDFSLSKASTPLLHALPLQSFWSEALPVPSRTASGLSPPPQELPPARPFYRTTFASHAPPIYLA